MLSIAVIGGGAAGMTAALAAASRGAAVSVYERQTRVGRKLAVTGNGRCNLTNLHASPEHYHGEEPDFVLPALRRMDAAGTLERFRSLGLLTVTEPDGRVYPLSNTAGSVVDVLRFALEGAGVRVLTGAEVRLVQKEKNGFRVLSDIGSHPADRVVVACGGLAGERFGGTGLGYRLLKELGHSCTPLRQGLVQLRSSSPFCRSLKGVRADALARVFHGSELLAEAAGEVQFTDYGLSGPVIFELSRAALSVPGTRVSLDLVRELPEEELRDLLLARSRGTPFLPLEDVFVGTVQNRLGHVLVRSAGLDLKKTLSALTGAEAVRLAQEAKHFSFPVTGDMGMPNAQVTVGGIRTSEFDPETLESRLCTGLYACGEVLDVDGDCGGYNLQWAWSSGFLAGSSAAEGNHA
ncbi:MAG: aminoacetone oxidase family FAD-binding enzyme [Oscillospiraceae bacterium]|nr:aminoacetone oxidase family FAD-binding enzyme [Oscillospiraceae bacterium]